MRKDIATLIEQSPRQNSTDWYKARLGHFTGSQVGRLMKKGRGKDADWSADALSYIKEVASERLINPLVVDIDEYFDEYLDLTMTSSKMIAWGHDNEDKALKAYSKLTGNKVTKCGSLPHESVGCFWDSPDGLLLEVDGVAEVKCPAPKTHGLYLMSVHTPASLLEIKPEYYWQCIAHMAVTGASFCDWMSYCKFDTIPLHIIHFERDEEVISRLTQRIEEADKLAKDLIHTAMAYKPAVMCHIS